MVSVTIGTVELDVLVSEKPKRSTVVTKSPVEAGADVADHSREGERGVVLECWHEEDTSGARARNALEGLQAIQDARRPVTITTPRAVYESHMVTSLDFPYTREVGNALSVTIAAERVRFVETRTARVKITKVAKAKGTAFKGAVATASTSDGNVRRSVIEKGTGAEVREGFKKYLTVLSPAAAPQ